MNEKVIIIGGGYSGLVAAKRLAENNFDVKLIDTNKNHIKLTFLHKTTQKKLSDISIPFSDLASNSIFHLYNQSLTLIRSI